jgi:oligoendopeptidase F
MLVIMEQTINFMGTLNPEYTQEILNEAQNEGRVVMVLDKDGKPSGAYIKVEHIDMKKFGKRKG